MLTKAYLQNAEVVKQKQPNPKTHRRNSEAITGYEAELWAMADSLRGSMDAAEYKHVVLGLIFLKYISDAFEEVYKQLEREALEGADPEDPDEYRAENAFWVPREARWPHLQVYARQPEIGEIVDDAMVAVERDNPALKGVLPKEYARPVLDKRRLGQLIDLISNIKLGNAEARSKDILGRVYEYFLSQFASAEGKKEVSSIRRAAWWGCWWQCLSPIEVVFTILVAAHLGCSSSRWSSSKRTPPAIATAVGHALISQFLDKSRTTRPGDWPR